MSVPFFSDLSFYSSPNEHLQRYKLIVKSFHDNFHSDPLFIARSPGRVNLIGDHIDYSYFSTLPMAIEYDVVAAVKPLPDSNEIVITNTDPQFQLERISLPEPGQLVSIDKLKFSWGSYFKCALIVAEKYMEERSHKVVKLNGLQVLFDGTVPTGGGLSSSAAFCVAATMAILYANGYTNVSKADLTRITVVSEHYVGVNTGGMDQCASVYGEKGKALLVQFKPSLQGKAFGFPDVDMSFLITNSLVQANKKETAPTNYNLRAVEVAIASEYLAHAFNLTLEQDSNLSTGTLRGFMDGYFKSVWNNDIDEGIRRLTKMAQVVEEVYDTPEKKVGFTVTEASLQLGITTAEFEHRFLSRFPVRFEKLKLYQRSKHVFSESLRVLRSLRLLREGPQGHEDFLQEFGELMDESQASLAGLYETSTAELASICSIARANGSLGSRITGAGFGGSVVHLVRSDNLVQLRNALANEYYGQRFSQLFTSDVNDAMTVSKPAIGTCVIDTKGFL